MFDYRIAAQAQRRGATMVTANGGSVSLYAVDLALKDGPRGYTGGGLTTTRGPQPN